MKKAAFLFPGIGYTCDKPLLYYSGKLLKSLGWEVVPVSWTGLDRAGSVHQAALAQAEEALRDIDPGRYDEILFVGKSLGTVACTAYAKKHGLCCRQVLFTPVEETFRAASGQAIVFHGTADPWMDTGKTEESCRRLGIPLYEVDGANHSLETGDVEKDIKELRKIMKTVREFVEQDH